METQDIMETKIMKDGNKVTVRVSGRVDTATATDLQRTIESVLGDCQTLHIDCTGLNYISSAGLRVLLIAYKSLKQKGGSIELSNVDDTILGVLKMTQFDSFLKIV